MTGRLIAVVGPSGAGKDTLLAGALAARTDLVWAQRVITRPASAGGEPFEGVDKAEFARRLEAGAFAFWWEAHGLSYGIPATILDQVTQGRTVVFNGSRVALPRIREAFPELRVVAVTAPPEVLAERLASRGREDAADVRARLKRAACSVPAGAHVVSNDGSVAMGVKRLLAAFDAGPAAEIELSENCHGSPA